MCLDYQPLRHSDSVTLLLRDPFRLLLVREALQQMVLTCAATCLTCPEVVSGVFQAQGGGDSIPKSKSVPMLGVG